MIRRSVLPATICAFLLFSCGEENPANTSPEPKGDPAHTLRVVKPNGGESFRVGEIITIQAKAPSDSGYKAVIEWSWNGGENWTSIFDDHIELNGTASVQYTIPDSFSYINSTNESMRVSSISSNSLIRAYEYEQWVDGISDTSDAAFAVNP